MYVSIAYRRPHEGSFHTHTHSHKTLALSALSCGCSQCYLTSPPPLPLCWFAFHPQSQRKIEGCCTIARLFLTVVCVICRYYVAFFAMLLYLLLLILSFLLLLLWLWVVIWNHNRPALCSHCGWEHIEKWCGDNIVEWWICVCVCVCYVMNFICFSCIWV